MISYPFLFTLVIVCYKGVFAKVRFEFGNLISPILVKTNNGNGTVFTNTRLMVDIKCLATYPTQWNFEEDEFSRIAFRTEWTQREVKGSIDDKQYNYISLIKVQYSNIIQSPQIFKCKPVNYSDDPEVLVLKFQPIRNDQIVLLTHYETYRPEIPKPFTPCDLKLSFVNAGPYGLYVLCTKAQTQEVGVTQVHHCPRSTAYCSNTLRNLKSLQNTCVEKLNDTSDEPVEEDGWTKIRFGTSKTTLIPGIVECSVDEIRGAQEYFFTAPKIGDEISNNRGELHFSWNEILPKDMIWLWMTPLPSMSTNSYYYTEQLQNISGLCTVPKYGFAVEPVLIRKLNGTTLSEERNFVNADWEDTWQKYFEIKLDKPGKYEVMCMGPVWNSTEWATQTFECSVRDSIPPYFDDPTPELVTLIEGEAKEVNCSANGDPVPNVQWYLRKGVDGVKPNGRTLTFMNPTLSNSGSYSCNASNGFGQYTVKIFMVAVSTQTQSSSDNVTIATGWLILSGVAAVLILICICVVVVYFIQSRRWKSNSLNDKHTTVECVPLNETPPSVITVPLNNFTVDTDTAPRPSTPEWEALPDETKNSWWNLWVLVDCSKVCLNSDAFQFGSIPVTGRVKGSVKTTNFTAEAFIRRADCLLLETKYIDKLRVEVDAYWEMSKISPSIHPSIVNLLATCAGIDWRDKILLATDYCEWKMFDFLQNKWITTFHNRVVGGRLTLGPGLNLWGTVVKNDDNSTTVEFSTVDMIVWGRQIASAFKFIESKGIHFEQFGMRNVYLTSQLAAKVGGFGHTTNLGPEECAKLEMGSYTFAWTQWHIFAFGGHVNLVLEQSDELLRKPLNAPDEIFELMKECLQPNVLSRPTLQTVIDKLNTCLAPIILAWTVQKTQNVWNNRSFFNPTQPAKSLQFRVTHLK